MTVSEKIDARTCSRNEWRAWHRYQRELLRAEDYNATAVALKTMARAAATVRFHDALLAGRLAAAFRALTRSLPKPGSSPPLAR